MEGVRARRSLDHGDRAPPAVGAMAKCIRQLLCAGAVVRSPIGSRGIAEASGRTSDGTTG